MAYMPKGKTKAQKTKGSKMENIVYKPTGVCSREIRIALSDQNRIERVQFIGGCAGNTQGVASLLVGMTAEEAISRLSGIRCGFKSTSCPDQLALALKDALQQKQSN